MPHIDPVLSAIIPPLQEGEFSLLEASIRTEGCRDALVVWDGTDKIVDGHNRYRICTKYNLPFKTISRPFADEHEAIDWICTNQLGRRNLSDLQRSDLRGIRYNHEKQQGARTDLTSSENLTRLAGGEELAQQEHVTRDTLWRDATFSRALDRLAELGIARHELTAGKRKVFKNQIIDLAKKAETDPDMAREVWAKVTSQGETSGAIKAAIREVHNERALKELPPRGNELASIILGDFAIESAALADNSVDAIITDPPYPAEYLPLWSALSQVAMHVLKPGGWCIAFSGKHYLDQVMSMMLAGGLLYYWQIIFLQTVEPADHGRAVNTQYKPILMFQKPPFVKAGTYFQDVIKGEQPEKDIHAWQQSENGFEWLIERFTDVGNLIMEPFCGSGTVPVVASRLKRRCIAYEIDAGTHASACKRLADWTDDQ